MNNSFENYLNDFDPDSNYFDVHLQNNHVFSSYDTLEDFRNNNPVKLDDRNFISVISQNIRSFNANLDSFLLLFDENCRPDSFIFSETWLGENEPVIIPDYTGFHTIRNHGRSGGVSIFVRNSLNAEKINELSYANDTIEICTVKIANGTSHVFICALYRPHSGTIEHFSDAVENILASRILGNSSVILSGDFNINLMSNNGDVDRFVDMMRSHHFLQTITGITHPSINNSAPSLLDHVWLNNISNYNSATIRSGVTDHYSTIIQLPFICKKNLHDKIKITFRDCSIENQNIFENKIANFDWETIRSPNPETFLQNFISILNLSYQASFPLKIKFVTSKYFSNPWHNKEVKTLSEARIKYHNLHLLGLVTRKQYSSFRNKVTNLIRKYKEKFYVESFARNFGNIKKTWETIREICNGKAVSSIDKILHNGSYHNEPSEIAAIFNQYFVTIAHDLADALPTTEESPYSYVRPNTSAPFDLYPVTSEEISNIIKSLKLTKTDVNEISVKLFKKYHTYFLTHLCEIINLCFSTGIFPKCLKSAVIIPIFKNKGLSTDISNYRPIALLPFISKIFERCIFNRLTDYATFCNLIPPTQFGFRKGKSTKDALIFITERIYDTFNRGQGAFNVNIFIDFKQAFDTIDHTILLNKLSWYGITGKNNDLISNYLSDRFQSVRIGNSLSPPLAITKGVPQGSILGSLLFLFFITDLSNVSDIFTSVLFADDLDLNIECNNIEQCNQLCNQELQKIFSWSNANKLSINFGRNKSYYIVHSYSNLEANSFNIQINNHNLENMSEAKYLGVIIDSKLKYDKHINFISEKISKSIGVLYKLNKLKIPKSVLKQIYYSLIYSILNYNICSYAGTYEAHTNRLLILQKRAIRLICGASFLAHCDPLFYQTEILKFHDIYRLNVALYMFDARHTGIFDRDHSYPTRSHQDLMPFHARLTVTKNSMRTVGPNIWNNIPQEIRNIPTKSSFKYHYKKYLISLYCLTP